MNNDTTEDHGEAADRVIVGELIDGVAALDTVFRPPIKATKVDDCCTETIDTDDYLVEAVQLLRRCATVMLVVADDVICPKLLKADRNRLTALAYAAQEFVDSLGE